jgi:hypothetical protein
MGDIGQENFRQVLRQGAHFEFEQNVFERAAAGLDANGLADGFDRQQDGDTWC